MRCIAPDLQEGKQAGLRLGSEAVRGNIGSVLKVLRQRRMRSGWLASWRASCTIDGSTLFCLAPYARTGAIVEDAKGCAGAVVAADEADRIIASAT